MNHVAAPSISRYLILDFQNQIKPSSSGGLNSEVNSLSLDVAEYIATMNKLGGKVTGLLIALIAHSRWDHESGWYFVEASQEEISKLASGGDHGWSPTPTREALEVLISAGYVRKVPGKALGRNKGSSPPKWVLSNDIFDPNLRIKEQAFFSHPKLTSSNIGDPNLRASKNFAPYSEPGPPGSRQQNMGIPLGGGSHDVDEMIIIHSSSDDNGPNAELLSLATVRELAEMGWMNAAAGVKQHGAPLLSAWIVTSRSKKNPGGFIRSQTKRDEWPFYPPGWDANKDSVALDKDGRLVQVERAMTRLGDTPPLLQVRDILMILDGAGELGREIKKLWLTVVDRDRHLTPGERSYELQKLGTELISRYGLKDNHMEGVRTA